MKSKITKEEFRQVPQRYPGDRKWKDEDVPRKGHDPKSEQDPLPPKKGKNKEREP